MLFGSNNTQMNIIEATPEYGGGGDYCVRNRVITPEASLGPIFGQNSAKWPKNGIPLFFEHIE